ncbi:MAG: hypothetical protein KJ887_04910 [Candidatus Omnitrophica bacterium]|nr:hypothetical protein [Candidatus Omnitrophota bacterium]MBU1047045.1 hypothetical protein [Candidatus Omnitrophota bacterium]MBU1630456.1 hypothetical protein [Candidatus Omnitrophota bacterium]MBU1767324.1 hypothetical protein [Candidatus Omnitrophota bacterium]MBU1889285.1 hypothetical protein [Candidatus Omnitrophota bacterium]
MSKSKIGNGYGSECHLLRYLGRHRCLLEKYILEEINYETINWLDFNFDCHAEWKDAELKGMDFLGDDLSIQKDWSNFWPQSRGIHNWDAVGKITIKGNKEWLLVEAKSHIEEIESSCGAHNEGSIQKIKNAFTQTQKALGVSEEHDWLNGYYQYANRLAVLYFLVSHGIKAQLLFIYFLGDKFTGRKCPKTKDGWKLALNKQKQAIGLPERHMLNDYIHELFIPVCLS